MEQNNLSFSEIKTPNGARISYRKLDPLASADQSPEVVFLGGYASDMFGSKASALEEYCEAKGLGFLRFDYRGHGQSDGEFLDFGILDWIADAKFVIEKLTHGPVILIGSSMGGWIALNIARDQAKKVKALICIAAAPDFSEDLFWEKMSETQKSAISRGEIVELPSGYDEPYRVSPKLVEQGRDALVMREPLVLRMPVRLLQGMSDASVSNETALRLAEHAQAEDLKLTFVKNADHSFSAPENLDFLFTNIEGIIAGDRAR